MVAPANAHRFASFLDQDQFRFAEGIFPAPGLPALERAIKSVPKETLIVFDMGGVLAVVEEPVLHKSHRPWLDTWCKGQPSLDEEKWGALKNKIYRAARANLVDPKTPQIVELAKQTGATICFSKTWVGMSAGEGSYERELLRIMKSLGIQFRQELQEAEGWKSELFKASYCEGLLTTRNETKGEVFEAFLEKLKTKPKTILFIDDEPKQCESMLASAKKVGITACCMNYTGAKERAAPSLNYEEAVVQLNALIETEEWLCPEAAAKVTSAASKD